MRAAINQSEVMVYRHVSNALGVAADLAKHNGPEVAKHLKAHLG